jgi:hypothetical protein
MVQIFPIHVYTAAQHHMEMNEDWWRLETGRRQLSIDVVMSQCYLSSLASVCVYSIFEKKKKSQKMVERAGSQMCRQVDGVACRP